MLLAQSCEGNIKEVAFCLFPIIAFALGILFTNGYGPSSLNTICCTGGRSLTLLLRRLFFRPSWPRGWDTAVNILVSFVCAASESFKRKVNSAQRGDDHVYRQSPQRYRADIPCPPHTRPIKKPSSATTKSSSFQRSARRWEPPCLAFAEKAILFCCLFLHHSVLEHVCERDI